MAPWTMVDGDRVFETVCAWCSEVIHRKRDRRPAFCGSKCRKMASRVRREGRRLRAELAKIQPDLDRLERRSSYWPQPAA